MLAQSERHRVVLFLLAGGTAAVTNIASRIAFNAVMPYTLSIICAYVCGMITAYVLNKYFVFSESGRSVKSEASRFVLVNLAAVLQVWAISVGLAYWVFPALRMTWHAATVAHVIGVIVPVFTSYLGHKHFSFARR